LLPAFGLFALGDIFSAMTEKMSPKA